jgi:hypothetical protein
VELKGETANITDGDVAQWCSAGSSGARFGVQSTTQRERERERERE